jgi:hypothetical protein
MKKHPILEQLRREVTPEIRREVQDMYSKQSTMIPSEIRGLPAHIVEGHNLTMTDKHVGASALMGLPIYENKDGVLFSQYNFVDTNEEDIEHLDLHRRDEVLMWGKIDGWVSYCKISLMFMDDIEFFKQYEEWLGNLKNKIK